MLEGKSPCNDDMANANTKVAVKLMAIASLMTNTN